MNKDKMDYKPFWGWLLKVKGFTPTELIETCSLLNIDIRKKLKELESEWAFETGNDEYFKNRS